MSPQNAYFEILTPKYDEIQGEAFGRSISHEGGAPMNGIGALVRDPTEIPVGASAKGGRREEMPALNQEEGLHPNKTTVVPWSWISSFQNCEK